MGLIRILQKWRLRLLLLECHYWNLKILDCISPLERNWVKLRFKERLSEISRSGVWSLLIGFILMSVTKNL